MADRRALWGLLLFSGLVLISFGLALIILYQPQPLASGEGPRIGVVPVEGVIADSRKAIEALRRFRKEKQIEAILLRIDSPGGAVGPSQEIYREIQRTKKAKPVVASMGTVAASGGYYIAAACDSIVANPGTVTGSIGVITQTTHVHQLLELARVEINTFKSGELKDVGSPFRPLAQDDRQLLTSFVEEIYEQFLSDVAQGRKLDEDKIRPVADGRIFSGARALEHKLVDKLGNFSDALELAARLAKAEGEPVPVYPPSDKGLLVELLGGGLRAALQELAAALAGSTRIEVRDPAVR